MLKKKARTAVVRDETTNAFQKSSFWIFSYQVGLNEGLELMISTIRGCDAPNLGAVGQFCCLLILQTD